MNIFQMLDSIPAHLYNNNRDSTECTPGYSIVTIF